MKSLETSEEIALDADRQIEAPGRTIIVSIFTGNHFGSGEILENAIGLVARDLADYFGHRP